MAFYIKDGSTWRQAKNVYVNNGGTWRTAKTVWCKDGSTWRASWMFNGALTIGSTPYIYGWDAGPVGNYTPANDYSGVYRLFRCNFYESGYVGAPKTSIGIYRNDSGQMTGITKTNLWKDAYIVGGNSVSAAAASDFVNFGTSCVWEWYSGDHLNLKANNGNTIQLQVTGI
jgi:hypothetical protein